MNENDNDTCPSRLPAKPWTVKCACIIADLLCLSVGAIMTPFVIDMIDHPGPQTRISFLYAIALFLFLVTLCVALHQGRRWARDYFAVIGFIALAGFTLFTLSAGQCLPEYLLWLPPAIPLTILLFPAPRKWFAEVNRIRKAWMTNPKSRLYIRLFEGAAYLTLAGILLFSCWKLFAFTIGINTKFQNAIKNADRIVIRDGGYNCCIKDVDAQPQLYVITNAAEIAAFNRLFKFRPELPDDCSCCGYPGIDWWQGEKKLALTAVKHGHALKWKEFHGAMTFSNWSDHHLHQWFADHAIPFND